MPNVAVTDDAPAAQPAAAQPAAPAAEPLALKVARHDLARWTERAKVLADAAAQANAAFDVANKSLADAKAAVATADKAATEAGAAVTAAQQAKTAADKALSDSQEALKKVETEKKDDVEANNAAKAAVDAAQKNAEAAAKQETEAVAKKKQADDAKAAAIKSVADAGPAVKPATDAKAAADKPAGEAAASLKIAQDRLAVLEKGIPKPDPAAVRLIQTITHDRPVLTCRFEPGGDFLFAGAEDSSFHRWDLFTASALHLKGHKSWIGTIGALSPTGNLLVTGGHEGKLAWWNALEPSPAPVRIIDAHKGYVRAIAVSPDGKLIATGGNDNLVRVWSAADGSLVKELAGHPRHVYNVAFHPSGKALISGDLMGTLKQWDVETWAMTRELDAKLLSKYDKGFHADVGGVRAIDFSPDGKLLAVGGITEVSNAFAGIGNPLVLLFEWESGKQLKQLKPKDNIQGSVWGVRFHPSGEFLIGAGGGPAGALWFWKPDDEKSFHAIGLASVAYDLTLHPDGLRLAVPLFDKTIRVYDMSPKPDVAAK
ncbi:MAG: WD40 repeat domain-containing protein [Planctomycetia bacterium]|nr:WD40 repeat domain-containing protein [Planctomycetia bacterium]